jgi:hypothetical protein
VGAENNYYNDEVPVVTAPTALGQEYAIRVLDISSDADTAARVAATAMINHWGSVGDGSGGFIWVPTISSDATVESVAAVSEAVTAITARVEASENGIEAIESDTSAIKTAVTGLTTLIGTVETDIDKVDLKAGSVDIDTTIDAHKLYLREHKTGVYRNVNLQNGPRNATQNTNGEWHYFGSSTTGTLFINVIASENESLTLGHWVATMTTDAQNIRSWGPWTSLYRPTQKRVDSANEVTVFDGMLVNWDIVDHDLKTGSLNTGSPLTIYPKGDWATRTRNIVGLSLASGVSLPAFSTDPVDLVWNPGRGGWTIRHNAITPVVLTYSTTDAVIEPITHEALISSGVTAVKIPEPMGIILTLQSLGTGAVSLNLAKVGSTAKFVGLKDSATYSLSSVQIDQAYRAVKLIGDPLAKVWRVIL